MDEYVDDGNDSEEEEEKHIYEAIRKLRRDFGPPEDYPKYQIDGIILSAN